jgi:hypothetical protein
MLSAIMLNVVAPFICLTKLYTLKVGFEPRKVYIKTSDYWSMLWLYLTRKS